MKNRSFSIPHWAGTSLAVLALSAVSVIGQDSPAPTPTPAATQAVPAELPYGVPEVLKLAQAHVNDGVIVSYIQNSGTIYNISAPEILYLQQQGVSDVVVKAMLDQRTRVTEAAARTAPPTSAASGTAQGAATYAQPANAYVASEPVYVPTSSTYVIPYPYATDAYYGSYYWPYYGGYYGYYGYYPGISFSFGYGGCYRGGYYGGGYYGGGFRGSGYYRVGGYSGGGYHGGGHPSGGFHGGGHH